MKRTAIAFVALTMCLTTMAQDWRQMMSRVEEHSIKSEVLGAERNYTVFLPAGYDIDKEKTYPVLYLLHGMDGTNKDWFDRAHIPCQLRVRDGGHTWEYWHSALYIALPWVSRQFGK